MKEKRKLSPGDTCVFYNNAYRYHGTVVRLYSGGKLQVRSTNGNEYDVHEKQCRFPKPKKAPAAPERVEWFEVVDENNKMQVGFGARAHAEIMVKANPSCRVAHLVELREGERILSRADLEKAWDRSNVSITHQVSAKSQTFDHICEMLGFREEREP